MPKKFHLYAGRAGQMAVMAEFLARSYNVAVPEVDIGDDIFVVRDSSGEYTRIQVKTSVAFRTVKGYSAQYSVRLSQLQNTTNPETWYIFANRLQETWISFLVISRKDLSNLYDQYQIGSLTRQGMLSLYLTYSATIVICGQQDLTDYLNNWSAWPYVQHNL